MRGNEIPRRNKIDKLTFAERVIREAMLEVEKLPADIRLTKAVVALDEAMNHVADYVDGFNEK